MPLFSRNPDCHRSLVLAGGGVRLAYHAGVMQALEEAGLVFDHVDGTSGGIFGTAMAASGISPSEAASRWRQLKLRGFLGAIPGPKKGFSLKIGDGAKGIREAIFPALGIDAERIRSNTDFDATFNLCNFSKKEVESIPNSAITTDHLVAGMSLPMFMPAIRIGNDWYTDSVWIKDCNLLEALRRDAEEIWLVWCIGNTPEYRKGYFNEYVCMIEISANAGVQRELLKLAEANRARIKSGRTALRIRIIKPEFPLPLDPDFFLKKIDADTLIAMGYADTRSRLEANQDFDWTNYEQATQMREADALLHFRQQFRGIAEWQGRNQQIEIRLGIFFYQTARGPVLRCSGVFEAEDQLSLCGYDCSLRNAGKGKLIAEFMVDSSGHSFRMNLTLQAGQPWSVLLGLDFKKASFILTDTTGTTNTYPLSQPSRNRILNAWHLSVLNKMKSSGHHNNRLRMLQRLLQ
ncbi:MAG: patatin-like phospholipase family protein [Bacteroidetes bacterium]|nr:patatin-like phospholipase family protein [Bacteroidota bacterium]MBS1630890.1 patatin-like phospholipase family protein [Bacteroidota bacterium]